MWSVFFSQTHNGTEFRSRARLVADGYDIREPDASAFRLILANVSDNFAQT